MKEGSSGGPMAWDADNDGFHIVALSVVETSMENLAVRLDGPTLTQLQAWVSGKDAGGLSHTYRHDFPFQGVVANACPSQALTLKRYVDLDNEWQVERLTAAAHTSEVVATTRHKEFYVYPLRANQKKNESSDARNIFTGIVLTQRQV